MKKKLRLFQWIWLLSGFALICAFLFLAVLLIPWKQKKREDLHVPIRAIIQTGLIKEALPTAYLAELLDLSCDKPQNASTFDIKKGEQNLLSSPVIKRARIRIKEPGVLYIDYTTRAPLAFLADFENIAIDQEGYPFPIKPFFTPKKLPEVYLGMDREISWNVPIFGEKKDLAFELLTLLNHPEMKDHFSVVAIDVSNAFEKSYGRREIVVTLEDQIYRTFKDRTISLVFPSVLRLSTKGYEQELNHYLQLREEIVEKGGVDPSLLSEGDGCIVMKQKIIDLRIPQLAFIEER